MYLKLMFTAGPQARLVLVARVCELARLLPCRLTHTTLKLMWDVKLPLEMGRSERDVWSKEESAAFWENMFSVGKRADCIDHTVNAAG